ncbi:fumarylacetoacetate hydrolase family protein [Vibrio genomosp. F10]|uniref:2-keto-4-pentenoate hydratase n=2 Tax=Vibrio genomosp. F10 TaxID=723171 RepID=A0A1B9R2C1_9VIBR|nr:fumarylacetoacetate hydrolase family protein [Vibrio genomosp. F10]OCH78439.1 2-keto-4-pentenoate hydratase [Vibrio genomosp. F10]OEE30836.1 2-keto-4-pentenoate hydratase [Vibrio genomosp. F10 str. ZF-129]OEE87477.1 2-keto-4-pentenoate hydratase [Vibrio genomosp. F10 str. 9ZD137]OEF05348.1 2-keto-4-pentenoate hydratase [Vibrio genomosp. F10 str. 9ZB36]
MHSVRVDDTTVTPSKIVCIGRNYLEHIQELNNAIPDEMVVFNKPNSALTHRLLSNAARSGGLQLSESDTIHYEGEICFVIKNGQIDAAGIGLDLTKRALQSELKGKGLPWERAKSFDDSAVFSRFVSMRDINIQQLQIELFINCMRVQCGSVNEMIYSPSTILAELQTYTTLCDGDIIMTGTPKGVGEVHQGDIFLARLKCGETTLIEIEWVAE